MWKRWAQGGPQTTCSGSFTLGTGTSTVSVPHFCGGEKDAEGGRGAQHHPGGAAGQLKTSGSVLNLSLDHFPANHPPKTSYLITPRLLAQLFQASLYRIRPLIPCLRRKKKKKKHGKIRNRRWRTFHFSSAHHLTSATGLGVGDQCFFLDGANCSLIWLEPESSLNQLLLRGAVSGIESTSEEGET